MQVSQIHKLKSEINKRNEPLNNARVPIHFEAPCQNTRASTKWEAN